MVASASEAVLDPVTGGEGVAAAAAGPEAAGMRDDVGVGTAVVGDGVGRLEREDMAESLDKFSDELIVVGVSVDEVGKVGEGHNEAHTDHGGLILPLLACSSYHDLDSW